MTLEDYVDQLERARDDGWNAGDLLDAAMRDLDLINQGAEPRYLTEMTERDSS